ncbi:hypothetical protein NL676_034797 [Syzygium grande]|nr:hypothetical protein NL676_034797 [Syzygium grande]
MDGGVGGEERERFLGVTNTVRASLQRESGGQVQVRKHVAMRRLTSPFLGVFPPSVGVYLSTWLEFPPFVIASTPLIPFFTHFSSKVANSPLTVARTICFISDVMFFAGCVPVKEMFLQLGLVGAW